MTKSPGEDRGFFAVRAEVGAANNQRYFSVLNQSSTSLWICSLAKP